MAGKYGAHRWTKEEDSFLLENYPLLGRSKTIEKLNAIFNSNVTADNARHHYKLLKSKRNGEHNYIKIPWTKEEMQFVLDNYPKYGLVITTKKINEKYKSNRSEHSVYSIVKRLRAKGCDCSIGKGSRAPESANPCTKWTEEEDRFIIDYYPDYGAEETAIKLNEIFKTNRTPHAVRFRASRSLHLNITSKARSDISKKSTQKYAKQVGDISEWKLSKGRTEFYIKNEEGQWVLLKHHLVGEETSGKMVIFLNGDRSDFRKENLAAITKETNAKMATRGFYSEDPEITKAGIAICELEDLLANK